MPNHVINVLKFKNLTKPQIKILKENLTTIEENEMLFDFNKIIKRPESLSLVSGSLEDYAIEYVELKEYNLHLDEKDKLEEQNKKFVESLTKKQIFEDYSETYKKYNINNLYDLGKLYLENEKKYGTKTWYDWSIENWGTKWNAYDQMIKEGKTYIKFIFRTAWSMPMPIYKKLEKLGLDFEVKYADEDYGSNCEILKYINGEEEYISMEGNNRWCKNLWEIK